MSHMIPVEPEQVGAAWLSEVTGASVNKIVGFERIGTGQMSRNFRLELEGELATVVIKVPASDLGVRALGAGSYQREVYFYRQFAPAIPSGIAQCHHAAISSDGTEFVLVLDDLAPATQGDQLAGSSIDDAERSLRNLARIHAAWWDNDELSRHRDGLPASDRNALDAIYTLALNQFIEHYSERLQPGTVDVLAAMRGYVAKWSGDDAGPATVTHGDYRLDNLMYSDAGVIAVDWQTANVGPPGRDVAYFLGNSLSSTDRRASRTELLAAYRDELGASGVDYGTDDLELAVAKGAWLGPLITVIGAFAATRTDRGDEMFITMADRCADQITQLDSRSHLS